MLYTQVLGASATMAGVRMLPYSLGASVTSALGGGIIARTGSYRPLMIISFVRILHLPYSCHTNTA
jgi:hypothetical protein